LKDPGADKSIILKYIMKKQDAGMGSINLVQDTDRWRAVVKPVMDPEVA
jgi:hypothetical protein